MTRRPPDFKSGASDQFRHPGGRRVPVGQRPAGKLYDFGTGDGALPAAITISWCLLSTSWAGLPTIRVPSTHHFSLPQYVPMQFDVSFTPHSPKNWPRTYVRFVS